MLRVWGRQGFPRLLAVIPAHNESACIGQAIDSLQSQHRPPDLVIVVADNCTDDTVKVARAHGAYVIETIDNRDKKAGALNQAFDLILADAGDHDAVMVLDADTVATPEFTAVATERLAHDFTIGAVGGIFHGELATSALEQAQANEYTRYARDIRRTGRVMVLTGTSAVFRVAALREAAAARGRMLPGPPGRVYNPQAITEDMELTLALKHLGWKLVSPTACRTTTELMATRGDLHRQRVRWYRGALDNLRDYGWTPVTRRYWGQQVSLLLGTVVFGLYLVLLVMDAALGLVHFNPWWASVGLVFLIDRIVTVWAGGWRARALALLVLPELVYDLLLQAAFLDAIRHHLIGAEPHWNSAAAPTQNASPQQSQDPIQKDMTHV